MSSIVHMTRYSNLRAKNLIAVPVLCYHGRILMSVGKDFELLRRNNILRWLQVNQAFELMYQENKIKRCIGIQFVLFSPFERRRAYLASCWYKWSSELEKTQVSCSKEEFYWGTIGYPRTLPLRILRARRSHTHYLHSHSILIKKSRSLRSKVIRWFIKRAFTGSSPGLAMWKSRSETEGSRLQPVW